MNMIFSVGCDSRIQHRTKDRKNPIFCAMSDAAVASDTENHGSCKRTIRDLLRLTFPSRCAPETKMSPWHRTGLSSAEIAPTSPLGSRLEPANVKFGFCIFERLGRFESTDQPTLNQLRR
jgi:hypothetical protein